MPSDETPAPAPDPAPSIAAADSPVVSEAESGQKLLQFLQRRLNLPPALLHRWVRTGQIRINGGRCKAFGARSQCRRDPPAAFCLENGGPKQRDRGKRAREFYKRAAHLRTDYSLGRGFIRFFSLPSLACRY